LFIISTQKPVKYTPHLEERTLTKDHTGARGPAQGGTSGIPADATDSVRTKATWLREMLLAENSLPIDPITGDERHD
jgi:hypothetical protein